MEGGYFYTNEYESQSKSNPFAAFEGYVEVPVYSEDSSSDGETEEKRALLADLEDDHISVSYTHLDVYKRQGIMNRQKRAKSAT